MEVIMFKTRLISGIVLMAITIALMVNGGFPLFWVITAISVIGLFELYRAVGMEKTLPAVVGYLSSIVIDILILDNYYEYLLMWLIASLMVLMACYVIAYPKYNSEQMTMLFFGLIYVTVMLSFVFKVRFVQNGILYVWLIFIGAWGSDTCAYCVGKLLGKHKLPSKLSPNKTIEGCLGGIIGAFITITVIQSMGSLGPAKAAMLIVISQLTVAWGIELAGIFGMEKQPFSMRKLLGLLIAAAGVITFEL